LANRPSFPGFLAIALDAAILIVNCGELFQLLSQLLRLFLVSFRCFGEYNEKLPRSLSNQSGNNKNPGKAKGT
jgi:hypothetical protein